jgi:hypothetical protein
MERLMDDPMISTLSDKSIIEVASTLIAKMDRPFYDETRTSIFTTPWGKTLFAMCAQKLMNGPFDIDEWYRGIKKSKDTHRDIDPSIYKQAITTDWMSALLQLEMDSNSKKKVKGSFLNILNNILELEDLAQKKLAEYCKKDLQYNCLGISKPAMPGKLLISAPPAAPKPGSVEDLLSSARK